MAVLGTQGSPFQGLVVAVDDQCFASKGIAATLLHLHRTAVELSSSCVAV